MRWATRAAVHVDRAACAWLIRRFIDAEAEFVFVDDPDEVPRDATAFDMRGVDLSHHAGDCSFETILRRYELADPVLWDLARIVHEADLADERYDAPEAQGSTRSAARPVHDVRRRAGPGGDASVVRRLVRAPTAGTAAGGRLMAERARLPRDVRLVLAAQALRAFTYGLGAVLLGRTLAQLRLGTAGAGLVLAASVAGTAVASVLVARRGDGFGRRRSYALLYLLLAGTGVVFAFATTVWPLALLGLFGALSTEVIESGPFTSLEQAMLSTELAEPAGPRFGLYNAVAALAGSFGALAAAAPSLLREVWSGAPPDQRWFLVFVPVALAGAVLAGRLGRGVEADLTSGVGTTVPGRSKSRVKRLSALFAVDSFAGGITSRLSSRTG